MKSYTVPVRGMSCAACARSVERAVLSVEGVESAEVNFGAEVAKIHGVARLSRVRDALRSRGYDVAVRRERAVLDGVRDAQSAQRAEALLNDVRGVVRASVDVEGRVDLECVGGLFGRVQVEEALGDVFGSLVWFEGTGEDPEAALRRAEVKRLQTRVVGALLGAFVVFVVAMDGMFPFVRALSESVRLGVQAVVASVVVLGFGWRFFDGAWKATRHGTADMNSLVALGTGSALGFSLVSVLSRWLGWGWSGAVYFDGAAILVALILLGRWMEAKARARTGDALRSLMELGAKRALRVGDDGEEEEVGVESVRVGDRLRVRAGDRVPVDGVVVEGRGVVDASMVTGEPVPVDVEAGMEVIGGTVSVGGAFLMSAEKVGAETMLARLVDVVREAQGSTASIQRVVDRVASVFVPVVLVVACVAFGVWLGVTGDVGRAVEVFVSVLVVACPCSLGLATPTAIMVGTGKAAEQGVLVRDASVLEKVLEVRCVVMDKTGTVTRGRPRLSDVRVLGGGDEGRVLSMVAAVERLSEHPLSAAIVDGVDDRGVEVWGGAVEEFETMAGYGVSGVVDGVEVAAGNAALFDMAGIALPEELARCAQEWGERGASLVFVALDAEPVAVLGLEDSVKDESADVIAELHRRGLRVVMLTGDHEAAAHAVAARVGIESTDVIAGVRPEEKAAAVKALQEETQGAVAMVGDGVNDAPALAAADLGVAMGTGTELAMEAAHITLMRGELWGVVRALDVAHKTMRVIRQNLFWAFVYNSLGIPIAAGVLVPFFGISLSPVVAGGAMAMSSVSVVLNALRAFFTWGDDAA